MSINTIVNDVMDNIQHNQNIYDKAFYKARAKQDVLRSEENYDNTQSEMQYEYIIHNATEEIRTALHILHKQPNNKENREEFIQILKRVLNFAYSTTVHKKQALVHLSPKTLNMSMSVHKMCKTLYEDKTNTRELFGTIQVAEGKISRILRACIVGIMSSSVLLKFTNMVDNGSRIKMFASILSIISGILIGKLTYSQKIFYPKRNSKLLQITRKAMKNKHEKPKPITRRTIFV